MNGHVYPEADKHPEWGSSYAQRSLLFHNLKNGKFELIPAVEGTGLAVVSVGRGAAFGDISTMASSTSSSTIWTAFRCCFAT